MSPFSGPLSQLFGFWVLRLWPIGAISRFFGDRGGSDRAGYLSARGVLYMEEGTEATRRRQRTSGPCAGRVDHNLWLALRAGRESESTPGEPPDVCQMQKSGGSWTPGQPSRHIKRAQLPADQATGTSYSGRKGELAPSKKFAADRCQSCQCQSCQFYLGWEPQ